ncbi:phosphoenolpyruvate carboxykinase (GTP) [bacterium]|nr:phosphoenolpyruvate carboxykinase (GTP) [bacterium]
MPVSEAVRQWVDQVSSLCQPESVVWCDGSDAERERLEKKAVSEGALTPLNKEKLPGCFYHRSAKGDVARTEHLTFICSKTKDDAGPTNNWMSPEQAREKVLPLFKGTMRGRTMYVVPFIMGPRGSRFSLVGVQLTDSVYVALNMRIMTRMGNVAWEQLGTSKKFTKCLHSLGDLSPERRYICHFPDENEIWSIGSGYGGNALLGKKCLALRIASALGKREGWLAEHMLIVGIESPEGELHYITGAFPSACGKTNLAMLVPPPSLKGWRVRTIGDDIAWLRPGPDGRLWAVNPEAGFFGVAPGTSRKTNPSAMATIARNTIYTNVALRKDGTVWWEGHDDPPGADLLDWQGQPWKPESGEKAAHPNSRFTAPASQCPSIAPEWEKPEGVPISAMFFGARRAGVVPLIYESFGWQHGTFLGATLASETTAAATGKVGVLRRDSMAMQPFCGYNMADYWAHWLEIGKSLTRPPKIFRVNWFRRGKEGQFLWPGFGDNLRVIRWALDRASGRGTATETAIGHVPKLDSIDRKGIDVSDDVMKELLRVDPTEWTDALKHQADYFSPFGDRLPKGIREEHEALAKRLRSAPAAPQPAR